MLLPYTQRTVTERRGARRRGGRDRGERAVGEPWRRRERHRRRTPTHRPPIRAGDALPRPLPMPGRRLEADVEVVEIAAARRWRAVVEALTRSG